MRQSSQSMGERAARLKQYGQGPAAFTNPLRDCRTLKKSRASDSSFHEKIKGSEKMIH